MKRILYTITITRTKKVEREGKSRTVTTIHTIHNDEEAEVSFSDGKTVYSFHQILYLKQCHPYQHNFIVHFKSLDNIEIFR